MKIFIKTLTGKTTTLDVESDETVEQIKGKISNIKRIPVDQLRLLFGGNHLKDAQSLSDYDIQKESTIYLVLRPL